MNHPETIKLDGITLTISASGGRVFVNVQKGVFSFLETMDRSQSAQLRCALLEKEWAAAQQIAGRERAEDGKAGA
jgi:hypothetical protein